MFSVEKSKVPRVLGRSAPELLALRAPVLPDLSSNVAGDQVNVLAAEKTQGTGGISVQLDSEIAFFPLRACLAN